MEFITQMKAFEKLSAGNLTPNAIAIYWKLFMIDNATGWKEWFTESDYWLGFAVGIKRHETIVSCLNLLKQKGFIDFERGTKRNQPTRYKIIVLNNSIEDSTKDSTINSTKDSIETSTKDSTKPSDIPRHKTKTKDNRQVNNNSAAAPKNKFVPPTLDDVNAYVMDKGLHVSAKDFWDYFEAGNWVDSKGQPVKNWKQKMLTWEKFNKKSTNISTGNPQVDMCKRVIEQLNCEGRETA